MAEAFTVLQRECEGKRREKKEERDAVGSVGIVDLAASATAAVLARIYAPWHARLKMETWV